MGPAGNTNDTRATFAGNRRGLLLSSWRSARLVPQPTKGERAMLKMIVAAVLVVMITSSSAVAGIMLSQSQSFRMVAKAPMAFDW